MTTSSSIAGEQLRRIVQRVERLEEEKTEIATQIRDVLAEAKANGFDVRILRQILKLRRLSDADRAEQEALLDLYKDALGLK